MPGAADQCGKEAGGARRARFAPDSRAASAGAGGGVGSAGTRACLPRPGSHVGEPPATLGKGCPGGS